MRLSQREAAKELFLRHSINRVPPATLGVVGPHILYQLGCICYVFPVVGTDEFKDLGHDNSYLYA